MNSFWMDVRYSLRTLAKSRAFATVAILTLALGIGANTAIFSMVDAFLLRPLPVRDAQQITVLGMQRKNGPVDAQFSVPDFRDIRSATSAVFSGMLCYQVELDGLSVGGRPSRVLTNYVTGNFFQMLGIQPALGRFFVPSEGEVAGADPVVVLGYSYWNSRFAGDRDIVGKKVSIDGHPMTVVGVAPQGFFGASPLFDVQVYLPLGMGVIDGSPSDFLVNRGSRNYNVLARLGPAPPFSRLRPRWLSKVAALPPIIPKKTAISTSLSIPKRAPAPTPIRKTP